MVRVLFLLDNLIEELVFFRYYIRWIFFRFWFKVKEIVEVISISNKEIVKIKVICL